MSSESILELTLGGFQVFAEPVTFPLGPITLIFGPNSAGKSAIQSEDGQVVAASAGADEQLVVGVTRDGVWKGFVLPVRG